MAQAANPGDPGLPCSPKQALALYQRLFQCPAGLGQLRAALRQVQEGQACPTGLELPTVLLEMERSRRAREQLLWDLELLTGAGLGLFWPPRAQFRGLRAQAQCAWSQHSEPHGRMGADSRQLKSGSSRLCSSPQAGDTLSRNHHFLEGGQPADPSSASDPGDAGSDVAPRWESPGMPAEPTPGCLQYPDTATGSSFGEPGNSEFKKLVLKEERGHAEPTTQRPLTSASGSLWGRKVAQEATGPSGLPKPRDPVEGLGWSLSQDRAELQKLLGIEIPQGQREENSQEEKKETPQGQGGEALHGENKDALQDPKGNLPACPRKEAPQRKEVKVLPSSGGRGRISQAWEMAHGESSTQPGEGGGSPGIPGDFCKSLGEQIPQPGRRESPDPGGRGIQLTQDKTYGQKPETALAVGGQQACREGALAPLCPGRSPAQPQFPSPGAVMLTALSTRDSEHQECPTALPGHPGLVHNRQVLQSPGGNPGPAEQQVGQASGLGAGGSMRFRGLLEERRGATQGPKASKAAWPGRPGREKASAGVSAAQQETALQRLLEMQGAARRRLWQDREQQRLRVLDCLRIARNRLCRVHPLAPPPSPAQLLPQKDTAGQRRALREQLEQVQRERTGRLRALGARNTQSFQQLLCPPGTEEPAPGK